VTVSLSGDGGDELFLGYRNYQWARRIWNAAGWMPGVGRRGLAGLVKLTANASVGFGAVARTRLARLGRVLEAETLVALHWDLGKESASAVAIEDLRHVRLGPGAASSQERTLTALSAADLRLYLPADILVKLDRAAMAVSLETRVPFLDHRVVEFALSLPDDYKLRAGVGKWVLREVLYRRLPKQLFERPKRGFAIPLADWLRGPLREWGTGLIENAPLEIETFLDRPKIRRLWREHVSGVMDHHALLWHVLLLIDWTRRLQSRGREG
jgi:asparagine synthase (glutamine-hydrolysing)